MRTRSAQPRRGDALLVDEAHVSEEGVHGVGGARLEGHSAVVHGPGDENAPADGHSVTKPVTLTFVCRRNGAAGSSAFNCG